MVKINLSRAARCIVQSLEPRRLFSAVLPGLGATQVVAMTVGDLNGDGLADCAVIHRDLAARNFLVTEYINGGNARFKRGHSIDMTPAEFAGMAIGDVNGDGAADIVVAGNSRRGSGPTQTTITVILGDGKGGFATDATGQPLEQTITLPGLVTSGLAVGDVDGDRAADIALVGSQYPNAAFGLPESDLDVIWGTSQGATKTPATEFAVLRQRLTIAADSVFTGDVDGDGVADLVVTQREGNSAATSVPGSQMLTVTQLANRNGLSSVKNNPLYEPSAQQSVNPLAERVQTLGLGDVNGDGVADLIGLTGKGKMTDSLSSGKTGQWLSAQTLARTGQVPLEPVLAGIGDLDGDGTPDILAYSTKTDVWSFGVLTSDAKTKAASVHWTIDAQGPT